MLVALFRFDVLNKSTITGKYSNRFLRSSANVQALEPTKILAIKGG